MPVKPNWEDILRQLSQPARTPDTMERRIELCYQALEQVQHEDQMERWAYLHFQLGLCFAQLPDGDRIANLEKAIENFGRALEVYMHRSYLKERRAIQRNLANLHYDVARLYAQRAEATGADDLERAIKHYQAALATWTPEKSPYQWAQAKHDLGFALFRRSDGSREENLEQAIACYEAALSIRTPDEYLAERAETQHNLGLVYMERYHDNRAENLERAIELLSTALETPQHARDPVKRAKTRSNLGIAYLQRIRGERADNVERAIECYQEALAVQEQVEPREELAATNHNLGIAYAERLLGNRGANLRQAITHLNRALKEIPKWTFHWATAHNVLSDAHWRLGNYLRHTDSKQAAHHFEQALKRAQTAAEVYEQCGFPRKWALAQHNLGNAYCDRIQGDRAKNLEEGIRCYRAALKVRTQEAYPFEWAQTQNNLGVAYWERVCESRKENLEKAVRCFCRALQVHALHAFPVDARRAARNLGNLYFEERHWPRAHDAYATALRAAEILYRASYSPGGKEAELAENTDLYEHMVQVCLEEHDYTAALVAVEGGKARTFLDQMGQAAFPPPPDLPFDLLQREEKAIEELWGQEQDLAALSGQGAGADREREQPREREIVEQRRETLAALEAVWDEMARDYPSARSYVAARRGEPMTWADLCALSERLGPKAALVEFYTLPDKIVVFVLRAGWEAPGVHRVSVGQRQLHRCVVSFFREVAERLSYPELNQTWQRLASPLLSDVLPHLKDAKLVYLIPHGLLHYLPLHALEVDGAPLIEHFPVAYAPSAAVLGRVIEQAEERGANGPGSALVVGDPEGNLPFAEDEARIIAQHFGVCPYLGQQATKDRVVDEVEGRRNVHLACHGYFHPLEPLQSGIVLHDGVVLTAQEILALRLQAELLVLSACQTAQQEVGRGDDLMGLTRTLLYARASSLAVSLWSVDDRSTGELMRRFYDILYGGSPSPRPSGAEALRQAMLDIRRQPGWEHPYYWAPFILVGIV